MNILYSAKFIRQYRKLTGEVKNDFEARELIFRGDNFDARLKTHKLHGRFDGFFSFSVNYKYRIVFEYINNKKDVRFHVIGNHDIYEN